MSLNLRLKVEGLHLRIFSKAPILEVFGDFLLFLASIVLVAHPKNYILLLV